MDDGIKTLGLHLCATCRELSATHLVAFILGLPITTYTVSLVLQDNMLFVFSESIEVKVGLLSEHVLVGCTVTESKCSLIT